MTPEEEINGLQRKLIVKPFFRKHIDPNNGYGIDSVEKQGFEAFFTSESSEDG